MGTSTPSPTQTPMEPSAGDNPPSPDPLPPQHGGNKKKLILAIIAGVVLIGAGIGAFALMQNKDQAAAKIKVGVLLPLSGGTSGTGYGGLKGIELAKKQLGADNIEIVKADSGCEAEQAAKAMQELIAKKVVAIIGDLCSGSSLAVLPQANQHKIPMISPSASSPDLSIANDYFFRVVPPDEFQGKFTAETMIGKGIKTASILYTDGPYGQALSKVFKENFEKLDGQVVSSESLALDEVNVQTHVDTIKAANPEGVYLILDTAPTAVGVIKLLSAGGVTASIYGADALYDENIITEAGEAAEGFLVTSFDGGTKSFRQSLAASSSDGQSYGAAGAYDALHAIFLATQKGATTGEQIKQQLEKTNFKGVTTTIKFNDKGEITENYTYDLVVAKDGAFVPLAE